MDAIRVSEDIEEFVRAVQTVFVPEQIILFGSRARGDHWKPSDYDFIIVSDKFAGVNWHDRMVSIHRFWNRPEGLDVLPYTPKEYEKKKSELGVVRIASLEGKRVIN
jgi:uncharacterized protein